MSSNLREAVDVNVQNRNVVVGLTAVKVNPLGFRFTKGILLRTPGTLDAVPNAASVWIGMVNITADTNIETGGFPLVPGSSLFLPVEFLEGLYAISTSTDQNLAWVGV